MKHLLELRYKKVLCAIINEVKLVINRMLYSFGPFLYWWEGHSWKWKEMVWSGKGAIWWYHNSQVLFKLLLYTFSKHTVYSFMLTGTDDCFFFFFKLKSTKYFLKY